MKYFILFVSFYIFENMLVTQSYLFVTPWNVACQALLSMEFSRQEYWSGYPFHSPGDLPDPGIDPGSPILQEDSLLSESEHIFHTCCFCCEVASVISNSLRPHRQQPTRLPCPWDSPGKNTGVGCHLHLSTSQFG